MTEKQAEKLKVKIVAIKKEMAREKKQWGGYHDGRGLRYAPPQYYIQLGDFKGAMTYFRWFEKTFSDDIGAPGFLFEWAIALFKNGKIKDAEKKVIETFMANTYVIDAFLKRPLNRFDDLPESDWHKKQIQFIPYSADKEPFIDFANWLKVFVESSDYISTTQAYIEIELQLLTEPVGPKRRKLVNKLSALREK
jgi:hypothetical protein